jgi:hypothetical protein
MKLEIKRFEFGDTYTVGRLYVNDVYECYTLEDRIREKKIPGQSAIPAGEYDVILDHSKRFNRYLPRILGVPNFEGIRIHMGNSSLDTEGCILLGKGWAGTDWLQGSQLAFDPFYVKLEAAVAASEDITISIS